VHVADIRFLVLSSIVPCIALSCTSYRAVGRPCHKDVWDLGPVRCVPGAQCAARTMECAFVVGEGEACDRWPFTGQDSPTWRHCEIWEERDGQRVEVGLCWNGRCVRAQRKGEHCTSFGGPGPWCRVEACVNGRCASE
jgi:hypothetical protein